MGIKESRLKSNKSHLTNRTLPNYNTELCPINGPNGGALSYMKEDIIYKKRNNLKILKSVNQFSLSIFNFQKVLNEANLIMTFLPIYSKSYSVKKQKHR